MALLIGRTPAQAPPTPSSHAVRTGAHDCVSRTWSSGRDGPYRIEHFLALVLVLDYQGHQYCCRRRRRRRQRRWGRYDVPICPPAAIAIQRRRPPQPPPPWSHPPQSPPPPPTPPLIVISPAMTLLPPPSFVSKQCETHSHSPSNDAKACTCCPLIDASSHATLSRVPHACIAICGSPGRCL